MSRGGQSQRGFTLLEMLVAFAIMALSLGMLYRASGGTARTVAQVEQYQGAVFLAESLLSLRDAVPEQGWNQSGASAGYAWAITSAPFPTSVGNLNAPPLHEIKIAISWDEGSGRQRQFELNTVRPQRKPMPVGRNL
ncbi:prepilin-type N-terminal cleavage/methylation domain-containing protein [Acidovorax delafieldii]|uniref:prepilin-type N-terminal cleavage/methylation domain-containing protein n=1 Tax=Acidovorax delafieldii TaxID=47920 RepID=UPI00058E509C|nr:prepilin-type N-terminal cleavage/methylation domain-containing protein [Acidovorax delafieldii]